MPSHAHSIRGRSLTSGPVSPEFRIPRGRGRHRCVWARGKTRTPGFSHARVGYRFYEPNLQRWLNRDPIEERGGINLYALLENDPIGTIDPFGAKSWLCRRALGKPPGTPPPAKGPLFHQYYCVQLPGSRKIVCYGQTSGGLYGRGRPTTPREDAYSPKTCTAIANGSDCFDRCLARKGREKRPFYGIIGPGTNCQEWSNAAIADCQKECPPQSHSPFSAGTYEVY